MSMSEKHTNETGAATPRQNGRSLIGANPDALIQQRLIVRDTITGFTGEALAYCRYNYVNHTQYLLQPRANDTSVFPEGKWFDEERLEVVSGQPEYEGVDVAASPAT